MSDTQTQEITATIASKVLETVDAGLVHGVGTPEPGAMCVEAAVCYALGLPHGDNPACVSPALRALKIRLNDSAWSSNEARAKGMRRLALAQLGSAGVLDDRAFALRLVDYVIGVTLPKALRAAASVHPEKKHRDAMNAAAANCETQKDHKAAEAAVAAAEEAAVAAASARRAEAAAAAARWAAAAAAAAAAAEATARWAARRAEAAAAAARWAAAAAATATAAEGDQVLSEFAEGVVQILIEMNAPGCQWLYLTEAA